MTNYQPMPKFIPLIMIMSDSMYVINGLTKHLSTWEDDGWIGVKNAPFFEKTAHVLKQRIAVTSFQWIKGHNGSQGNEGSDQLAKEGANKPLPDPYGPRCPKRVRPARGKTSNTHTGS